MQTYQIISLVTNYKLPKHKVYRIGQKGKIPLYAS